MNNFGVDLDVGGARLSWPFADKGVRTFLLEGLDPTAATHKYGCPSHI